MRAKKIDLLRLCLVQFDIKPLCKNFGISELDVYHLLSTRYLNKFSRSESLNNDLEVLWINFNFGDFNE